jgi:predicted DCC family thiol-disulfide oxidoreductase YuxK
MNENPIILFDGVCNFCNGAVNFIIKKDKKRAFRYAALQSDAGQQLLKQYHLSTTNLDSFVLVFEGKVYIKTSAALHVGYILGGAWKLTGIFKIFPSPIRDMAYNLIARNRYRWFGKKESCMIPTAEVRSLFLS